MDRGLQAVAVLDAVGAGVDLLADPGQEALRRAGRGGIAQPGVPSRCGQGAGAGQDFLQRRLGDRLVLAVNSDDSIRRLKGPGRPINSLERRMAVLAALEAVDYVVAFDTDTPEPLLEKVRPDILVKGGDYSVDQVVGADIVKRHGGRVEVLDFVENISTTHIVQKIRSE